MRIEEEDIISQIKSIYFDHNFNRKQIVGMKSYILEINASIRRHVPPEIAEKIFIHMRDLNKEREPEQ